MQAIKIIVIIEKSKIYFGENTPSTPTQHKLENYLKL